MKQKISIMPCEEENLAVIMIEDHTEIEEAYARVEALNERSNYYLDIIDEHVNIVTTDSNGIIISVSQSMCNLCGYAKEELIGQKTSILRHPDTYNQVYEELWKTISAGDVWRGDLKNKSKSGETFYVKSAIFRLKSFNEDIRYQSILEDVTDKKKIELLTITDDMTKLFNRRHFNDMFMRELSIAKRYEKIFVFFMIDVDFFKQYNDEYGHKMGDDALISVAKALQKALHRSEDLAFRLGGEEFGAIACVNKKEGALELAERIRKSVQALNIKHVKNSHGKLTVSIGVHAINAKDANLADNLIKDVIYSRADDALYEAKKSGRNMVCMSYYPKEG